MFVTGAGELRVQVRRARPGHGRHQTPVGRADRRRGPRPVQPRRAGRHGAHGRLYRGPGERFQRGGQQVGDRGTRADEETAAAAAATATATAVRATVPRRRAGRASGPGRAQERPALGQRPDK